MVKPTAKSKFRVAISGLTLFFSTFKGGARKPDTAKATTGDGVTYTLTSNEKIEDITLGIPYDADTYKKLDTFYKNFDAKKPAILVVEELDGTVNKKTILTHEFNGVEPLSITTPEVDTASADAAMIEITFAALGVFIK